MRFYRLFLGVVLLVGIAYALGGATAAPTAQADPAAAKAPPPYVKLTDDAETLTVLVPSAWRDVETGPWRYDGKAVGVFVAAAPDLDSFYAGRKAPGVFLAASRELAASYTAESLLAAERRGYERKCKYQSRTAYRDAFYSGQYDTYADCAGGGHKALIVAATPADRSSLILLRMNNTKAADLDAVAKILASFQLLGAPGQDGHHDH